MLSSAAIYKFWCARIGIWKCRATRENEIPLVRNSADPLWNPVQRVQKRMDLTGLEGKIYAWPKFFSKTSQTFIWLHFYATPVSSWKGRHARNGTKGCREVECSSSVIHFPSKMTLLLLRQRWFSFCKTIHYIQMFSFNFIDVPNFVSNYETIFIY